MLSGSADVLAKSVEIKETTTENAGQTYTLRVYDINKEVGSDNAEDLIYADEAKSDDLQNVTFSFDIDITSGYYPYIIKSKSGQWEKTGKLSFINDKEFENAEKELSAALKTADPGSAVKSVFESYPGVFQLDDGFEIASDIEKLNTSAAYANIAAGIKADSAIEDIKKIYKTEMFLVAAQYGDSELIARLDSEYLYSETEIGAVIKDLYDNINQSEKQAVASMEKGAYGSLDEYAKAHMKAVGITAMNASDSWMELKKIIEDTYNIIGISKPASNDVYNTFYSKRPFSGISDYEKKLGDISANSGSGNTGSGSSGGGIKSTGGGKGYYDSTPVINVPSAAAEERFTDIASVEWAKEAIEKLAEKGVISGKGDKIFAPDDKMTREEFVKLVVGAFELSSEMTTSFADVDYTAWYAPYINIAAANGVVKGISDTEFGIGKNITRQDAAVIIARAAKSEPDSTAADIFVDAPYIADYAKGSVGCLAKIGAINGNADGSFLPGNAITRAEAVKIVYNVTKLQYGKGM